MAGPNDYHMDGAEILPGLGKDEITDEQRALLRQKGGAKLLEMKAELEDSISALNAKEREVLEREQAALKREAELDARERALTAAAKKGPAKSPVADPPAAD